MSVTLEALLRDAADRLRRADIEGARAEARLLLRETLNVSAETLFAAHETPVDESAAARFRGMVERRAAREPISRILGTREFWSLPFAVSPDTLDPRPDSETLIEAVLAYRVESSLAAPRILDLGTGSGCLICALLHEMPDALGVGTDIAAGAVAQAMENAAELRLADRVRFVQGDWDSPVEGRFDIVISNPPYIPDAEIDTLAPEVALWEPRTALDGGKDGLDAYRALGPVITRRLSPDGAAFVEIGAGQADPVEQIFSKSSLNRFVRKRDLGGIIRCIGVKHFFGLTDG